MHHGFSKLANSCRMKYESTDSATFLALLNAWVADKPCHLAVVVKVINMVLIAASTSSSSSSNSSSSSSSSSCRSSSSNDNNCTNSYVAPP